MILTICKATTINWKGEVFMVLPTAQFILGEIFLKKTFILS